MHLCLTDEFDRSLGWLRGAVPGLVVVAGRDVGGAVHLQLEQVAGSATPASGHVRVGDRNVAIADLGAVLCRLPALPVEHLGFRGVDLEYATAEWNALLAGWLAAAGDRVVNRPEPHALAGPWASAETWAVRAAAVGLVVDVDARPPAPGRGDDVIVIGGRLFGRRPIAPDLVEPVLDLAAGSGARVVGFSADAGWDDGRLRNLTANPCPSLEATGRDGAAALRHLLGAIERTTGTRVSA